ncbi:MAG TPA: hypothetical protein VN132_13075, partial [Bdellovibrio sp.]|nr:hypothetical protein [Bdellovibrio sp.]
NINYSEWGVELHLDQAGRPLPQLASREVHSVLSFLKQDPASKTIAIQINDNQYSVPFCGDIASRK